MGLWSELTRLTPRDPSQVKDEVTDSFFDFAELREGLLEWEKVYNTIRPHHRPLKGRSLLVELYTVKQICR